MDTQFQLLLRLSREGNQQLAGQLGGNIKDDELLESLYFDVQARGLSKATLRCYAQRLGYLVQYCRYINKPLAHLEKRDIMRYILTLRDSNANLSEETINGRVRVFKLAFKLWHKDGLIEKNPTEGIIIRQAKRKIKPVISPKQFELLLRTASGNEFHHFRNRAMLMTTYDSACRVGELCSMKLQDAELVDGIIKVHGNKGRRERFVPISGRTAKHIHSYILKHRRKVPGDQLFCTKTGNPMTELNVYHTFRRIGERANLSIYPHLLRHSGATEMLKRGMSPLVLQRILGHRSQIITSNYIHLSVDDLHEMHNKFRPMGGN